MPAGESWEFNQSVFDLGATVCTAEPTCASVPAPTMRLAESANRSNGDNGRSVACVTGRHAAERLFGDQIVRGGAGCSMPSAGAGCATPRWPARAGGLMTRVRAQRVAAALVDEGFARWSGRDAGNPTGTGPSPGSGAEPVLRLR